MKKQILFLALSLTVVTAAQAQWIRGSSTTTLEYPTDYVGIGGSPSTKLQVTFNSLAGSPQLKLKESEVDFARMYFQNTSGIRYWSVEGKNDATVSNERFRVGTSTNADLFTIDGNGNMAIGNANPESKLEMVGTGAMTLKLHSIGAPASNYGILKFESEYQSSRAGAYISNAGSASALTFGTFSGSIYTPKFVLNGSFLRPDVNGAIRLGDPLLAWHTVYSVNGYVTTSDGRLKTGITDLNYGLKEIMSLRPVSYTLKENPECGTKLGLIAQEVDKVVKEVVVHGVLGETAKEDERLGIMYSDLIPVLIKGIQEQQQQIEGLRNMVESLLMNNATGLNKGVIKEDEYKLVSSPNPATGKATISFNIPANASTAQLVLMDATGKKIKSFSNLIDGLNTVVLETASLQAGSYIYSLVLNGSIAQSKILSVVK